MPDTIYDFFISYASENVEIAQALDSALAARGYRVWRDRGQITVGDSITSRINEGLAVSRFAIVIFSKEYFSKNWTRAELNALLAHEIDKGLKIILGVRIELEHQDVADHLPLLGDRFTVAFNENIDQIVGEIELATNPSRTESSAIAASRGRGDLTPKHPRDQIYSVSISGARALAATLLEAGKRSWKMPLFVAPLGLEAYEKSDLSERRPISISELSENIAAGQNLALVGEGGIGKTVFLLDLCATCLDAGHRVPLFVDAAMWARQNASLFDYLAGLPAASLNRVTATELTKLASAGSLVVMLNGWNEMSAASKLSCLDSIIQLTAAVGDLNMVVVSRTLSDTPALNYAKRVEVCGLRWKGQVAIVQSELGQERSGPLLTLLAKDTRLRHAARSPIILRGLVSVAKRRTVEATSVYDLLGAAIQAFEEDEQRKLILTAAPIDDNQSIYLEELACRLTDQLVTNCSRGEALRGISAAATSLVARQQISAPPSLQAVLDTLASHHLLHLDDGVVRFAHQRFQEYFAATRILRECENHLNSFAQLRTAVNSAAWQDSLTLVAAKLKEGAGSAAARSRLLKIAATVDLGFACDLAGICAFRREDDAQLHDSIVSQVNELSASTLEEVRALGVCYQIASGLPAFAEQLWKFVESEDQQIRLQISRMNGMAISVVQLGPDIEQRVASWPSDRRVEFIHEIASNTDNYDFLVDLAQTERDAAVRVAAIRELFWYFLASAVPLQAWIDAPVEVQRQHDLLFHVRQAVNEGYASDVVREHLLELDLLDDSDDAHLWVALNYPDKVTPRAVDIMLERLRSREAHRNCGPLVKVVQSCAPDRLVDVARTLVLQARFVPDWVGPYLQQAPVEVRLDVVERVWNALLGADCADVGVEVAGTLASRDQIARIVEYLMQYEGVARTKRTWSDVNSKRRELLKGILAHVSGVDLLDLVKERAQAASYREAALLVDLVAQRLRERDSGYRISERWIPTAEEIWQLIVLFSD